jgi:DNA modification methylase
VAGGKAHTVADTALEVHGRSDGSFHDDTRKSLIVAQHLADPDVAKAKNVDDAFKILKKKESVRQNEALALEVGKTYNSSVHSLFNGSFSSPTFEPLKSTPFDVILTDPPYGMGADEFGDAGGKLVAHAHDYKDDYEHWLPLMREFTHWASLVTKPEAHVYAFCDIERFAELRSLFLQVGFEVHRTPLIWTKPQSHRVPWPDYGPRRHWESILYAVKGKKKTTAIYPDVVECKLDENLGHPAQKPVDLLANLLRRSVVPGSRVIDPFCGTGGIFAAAHQLKCYATGIELSPGYYGIALKRLQQLDKEPAKDSLAELMA